MPHTLSRIPFIFLLLLSLAAAAAPTRAACPPAVTSITAMNSICAGPIRITYALPPGQLLFPQLLRANIPVLALASVVTTGSLNSTTIEHTPPSTDLPFSYWIRWTGIDSACLNGPVSGPFSLTSYSTQLASLGTVLPAPQPAASCNSITLSWTTVREATSIAVKRGPHNGPYQTIATLPATATTYTDSSGIPNVAYAYVIAFTSSSCQVTSQSFQSDTVFPPAVPIPTTTSADVLSGTNATLTVNFPFLAPGFSTPPRWFRGTTQVTDIPGHITGSATTQLQFTAVTQQDMGVYTFRAQTPCAEITPINLALIVRPACPADFNADTHVRVDDIFGFLTAWFAGCP